MDKHKLLIGTYNLKRTDLVSLWTAVCNTRFD